MALQHGSTLKRLSNAQQAQASRYLRENDPEKYQHKSQTEAARLLSRDLGFYVPHTQVDNIFVGAGLDFIPANKKYRGPAEVAELKVRVATLEAEFDRMQVRLSRILGTPRNKAAEGA